MARHRTSVEQVVSETTKDAPTQETSAIDEGKILDYITGSGRTLDVEYAMTNNFAFGGVNTSLIFARSA